MATKVDAVAPIIAKMTYVISVRDGSAWLRLSWDSTGSVHLQSDYGSWTYVWPRSYRSEPMVRFLASLDWHYMGKKMMGSEIQVYDSETTIRYVRQSIIEQRRNDGEYDEAFLREQRSWLHRLCMTRERARDEWDLAEMIETDGFEAWVRETSLAEACDYVCLIPNPAWKMMWDRLWEPLVRPALKAGFDDPVQMEL